MAADLDFRIESVDGGSIDGLTATLNGESVAPNSSSTLASISVPHTLRIKTTSPVEFDIKFDRASRFSSASIADQAVTLTVTLPNLVNWGEGRYHFTVHQTRPKTRKPIFVEKSDSVSVSAKEIGASFKKEIHIKVVDPIRQEFHFTVYRENKSLITTTTTAIATLIVAAGDINGDLDDEYRFDSVAKVTRDGKPLNDSDDSIVGPSFSIKSRPKIGSVPHTPVKLHRPLSLIAGAAAAAAPPTLTLPANDSSAAVVADVVASIALATEENISAQREHSSSIAADPVQAAVASLTESKFNESETAAEKPSETIAEIAPAAVTAPVPIPISDSPEPATSPLAEALIVYMKSGDDVIHYPYPSSSRTPTAAVKGHLHYMADASREGPGILFFADADGTESSDIELNYVLSVLSGKGTANLKDRSEVSDSLCLSLIRSDSTFDIQFPDQQRRDAWVAGLRFVINATLPNDSIVVPSAAPVVAEPVVEEKKQEVFVPLANGVQPATADEEDPDVNAPITFERWPAGPLSSSLNDYEKVLSYTFQVKASHLIQTDWLSKSDPIVALVVNGALADHSEVHVNDHDPVFTKVLALPNSLISSSDALLTFTIYDVDKGAITDDHLLGQAQISLSALSKVAAAGSSISLPLVNPQKSSFHKRLKKKNSMIHVRPISPLTPQQNNDEKKLSAALEDAAVKGALEGDEAFLDDVSQFFPTSPAQTPIGKLFSLAKLYVTAPSVSADGGAGRDAFQVSAANLIQMDWLSKSDPIAVLTHWDGVQWVLVDHTEWLRDNHDPLFKRSIYAKVGDDNSSLQYYQILIFDVDRVPISDDDLLGAVVIDSDQLRIAQKTGASFPLTHPDKSAIAKRLRKKRATVTLKGSAASGEEQSFTEKYAIDFNPPKSADHTPPTDGASAAASSAAAPPTENIQFGDRSVTVTSSHQRTSSTTIQNAPVIDDRVSKQIIESIGKWRSSHPSSGSSLSVVPNRGPGLSIEMEFECKQLIHVAAWTTIIAFFEKIDGKYLLLDNTDAVRDAEATGKPVYGKKLSAEYYPELSQEIKFSVYNLHGKENISEDDVIGNVSLPFSSLISSYISAQSNLVSTGESSAGKIELEFPLNNDKNKSIDAMLKNKNAVLMIRIRANAWLDEAVKSQSAVQN